MKPILACIDFSDTSIPVLDEADRLAEALDAKIVVLHVEPLEPDYVAFDMGYAAPTTTVTPVEQRAAYSELQRWAKRLKAPDRQVETVYDHGLVIDRIVASAGDHDAGMLVMGSHGHGALYHLLMGSVTEGVLRKVNRPVLVVPAQEPSANESDKDDQP
jgi:nucleotide-binding universal stress UspA family protein